MTTTTRAQRRARPLPLTMTAYGVTKTIGEWGKDPRCFISSQALRFRVTLFEGTMDTSDAEAALCFPRRMWTYYNANGCIETSHLEALTETEQE